MRVVAWNNILGSQENKRKNLQMFDINELNENLDFRRMVDEILVYI